MLNSFFRLKIYIYVYIYIFIYLPVTAIVRLPHSWSGDSQGQETFSTLCWTSKLATMTQSAQTTIPPYQPQD